MIKFGRSRTETHEKSMGSYELFAWRDAIAFLETFETESDGVGDKEARAWLVSKLNGECDRLVMSSEKTKGGKIAAKIIAALTP